MLDIVYNHIIVIVAFTIFLGILILLPTTCINAISQILLLILLFIYLTRGINHLLKLWHILMFYQAITLIAIIGFQFMINMPYIKE